MTLPGPEKLKIVRADSGYVVEFEYRPTGRKTPVKATKIAQDEFELKSIIREVYE